MNMPSNGAYTRTNSFGPGEAKNYPRFFTDAIQDHVATAKEGRAIFVEVEFVEIIAPGNPYNKPVHKVTDDDRQMWPAEYDAFRKGMEISADGTPLEQWPLLKRAMVMQLKHLGFNTVEQVAAMSDLAIQQVGMGGRNLKENAIAFLDVDEAAKLNTQLTAERDRKDAQIAALSHQVEQLSLLVQSMHSQSLAAANAPNPVATVIPGLLDPIEQHKGGMAPQPQGQAASFGGLPVPRKRGPGRPSNAEKAAAAGEAA